MDVEIAPRVHSIKVETYTFMGLYAPNVFLIVGEEAALVDSGYKDGEAARTCIEYIESLAPLKLAYVVVTHPHPDHIGGCRSITEITGAKVVIHPLAAGQAEQQHLSADILVEDSDILDIGGISLEIIHTPGHTSGNICIHMKEEGILFTGDHILGIGTTVIDVFDGDMAQYIDSLKKLLNRGIKLICPGHGPLIRQPELKIKELISHRQQREQQILSCLNQGKTSVAEMVSEIYPELDPRLVTMANMQVMAHLKKLVLEEKAAIYGDEYILK